MKVKPSRRRGKVLLEVSDKDGPLLEPGLLKIRRILIPVDFSSLSDKALDYGLAFARQFQAQLLILHVVEIPYGTGEAAVIASFMDDVQRDSQQKLNRLIAQKKDSGLSIQGLLRTGTAYHEIVEAAREHQVDIIIVSTHGHTGLRHVFLGSTAERVVRHAPCPVLVVRAKEQEFVVAKTGSAKKPQHMEELQVSPA